MNGFALDKEPPQKTDRSLMDDDGARGCERRRDIICFVLVIRTNELKDRFIARGTRGGCEGVRSLPNPMPCTRLRLFHCSASLWVRVQLWRQERQESFCFAT